MSAAKAEIAGTMAQPLAVREPHEPRVDRRVLAAHIGNEHRVSMALIEKYDTRFNALGILPFQMEKPSLRSQSGRAERFSLRLHAEG
ncbi:hypothetical protein [Ralstonia sp.]|uniref:hypothetical protein n=1 Tax=Ralstonia sp. TaxID=54061 RepID=UPI0031CE68CD